MLPPGGAPGGRRPLGLTGNGVPRHRALLVRPVMRAVDGRRVSLSARGGAADGHVGGSEQRGPRGREALRVHARHRQAPRGHEREAARAAVGAVPAVGRRVSPPLPPLLAVIAGRQYPGVRPARSSGHEKEREHPPRATHEEVFSESGSGSLPPPGGDVRRRSRSSPTGGLTCASAFSWSRSSWQAHSRRVRPSTAPLPGRRTPRLRNLGPRACPPPSRSSRLRRRRHRDPSGRNSLPPNPRRRTASDPLHRRPRRAPPGRADGNRPRATTPRRERRRRGSLRGASRPRSGSGAPRTPPPRLARRTT